MTEMPAVVGNTQLLTGLQLVQESITRVMHQAKSNHQVLLDQIDDLLQIALHADAAPSSGTSSRISTSSLSEQHVDSESVFLEQPNEQFTVHPLGPCHAPESNVNSNGCQAQSIAKDNSNQFDTPQQNQEPISKHKTCKRKKRDPAPRRPLKCQGSMNSDLSSIIPDSASDSGSCHSNSTQRLSNSSRNSRLQDLHDMKKNYLFRMHGIDAEGSTSSSSQVWANRFVQASRNLASHRPLRLQPDHAEEHRDAQDSDKGSASSKQEDEDKDALDEVSVASSKSIEDIPEQGHSTVELAASHRFNPLSFSVFRQSKIIAMRSSLESQLVEKMMADELMNSERVPYHSRCFYALCRAPRILLNLFGIAPWGAGPLSTVCFHLSTLVPLVVCALSVNTAVQRRLSVMEAASFESQSFGCLLAMLGFRWHGAHKCVGSAGSLLDQCAKAGAFPVEWHWKSCQHLLVIMCGGTVMCVGKLCFILDPAYQSSSAPVHCDIQMICDLTSLMLTTGFFVAIMYCQVLVSSGLSVAVDICSSEIVAEKDLACALSKWEMLQAVLRQAARSIEGCFCGLGMILVAAFVSQRCNYYKEVGQWMKYVGIIAILDSGWCHLGC